ncbi:ANF-receptor domain-containing protein [Aphelenchoides bicaudatus]|nr:ANF-receptor domain-containing protein [Aphelenchoides bicaudatus]
MLKILWLCLIVTSTLSTSNNIVTTNGHPHRLHHRPCGENCTLNSTATVFHRYEVSARRPAYILFPLPTEIDEVKNPFGILVVLVEPVVDVALEDVYKRGLLEEGSIKTVFDDSKMSDAHGPNLAIRQLVANKLDCIIGYGFIYSLAIVSRMTPYWADADSNGIPVLTTVGLSTNLDDKTAEYTMMTRMVGPYKFVIAFIYRLFLAYKWRQAFYFYHNDRSKNNPNSECYMVCVLDRACECIYLFQLMSSLSMGLYRFFKPNHTYDTINIEFNQNRDTRAHYREKLKSASFKSNGFACFFVDVLLNVYGVGMPFGN